MTIRDRIIDRRKIKASDLKPSPHNWRTHPDKQREALRSILRDIGWAGVEITRILPDGSLELIDGHLRAEEMGDQLIDVAVTDLDEAEARKLLAVFDTVGRMAGIDEAKLAELMNDLELDGPLQSMLDDLLKVEEEKEKKAATIDLTPQYGVLVKVPDESTQRQLLEQADTAGFEASAIVTGLAPERKQESLPPPAPGVVRIIRETPIRRSVRVRQVEGMFDVPPESSAQRVWDYRLDLPAEWSVGLIVGPSGGGKSTLARELFGDRLIDGWPWPADASVVDGFPESLTIQEITGLLSSVGFSSPPGWLKPYHVLSNGEKFRVDVARTLAEQPDLAVIDEFTSVVDRTVAQIGSHAVQKAVRKSGRRLVAVSCHYDIAEWLEPDWMLDVQTSAITRRSLRRPQLEVVVRRVDRSAWSLFRDHHYLSHDLARNAACFVAKVRGQPAAFLAVLSAPHPSHPRWRASRIVCLPDYQGIGVGGRLTDLIAAAYSATGKEFTVVTSHPALIARMARHQHWRCINGYHFAGTSVSHSSTTGPASSGQRLTASFVFNGPPDSETATALGILKS